MSEGKQRNRTGAWIVSATLAVAVVAGMPGGSARAQTTLSWAADSSGSWENGQQGNFDSVWDNTASQSALFSGANNAAYTVSVAGSIDLVDLTFDTTGTAGARYTISGGTLDFAAGGIIQNKDNRYNQSITSAITGSPEVRVADFGAGNTYEGLKFEPALGVTQALGTLWVPYNGIGTTDKAGLYLGGTSTTSTASGVTRGGSDNYGTLYKTGSGTWTVGDGANAARVGTIRIQGGTLALNGLVEQFYNGLIMSSGGTLAGDATVFKNDRRSAWNFISGSGISPGGGGVGEIEFDWGTAGGPTTTQWLTAFRAGSTYTWEAASAASTDVVNIVDGGLVIEGFTLNIVDLGFNPVASDQLPVFTYGTLDVSRTSINLAAVAFDNTLAPDWDISSAALVDNGAGTIYLTGVSAVPEPSCLAGLGVLLAAGLGWRRFRRRS